MDFINNDPAQIKIRKSQNTLIVVGTGTVLFGIWDVVKVLSVLFMRKKETVEGMRESTGEFFAEYSDAKVFTITLVIFLLFLLILLSVRTFVGLSALSEGRGLRRRRLYIPIAVVMIILDIMVLIFNFFKAGKENAGVALLGDNTLSGLIVELTSMIMLAEMVVAAVRIRRMTGRERKSGGH